MIRSSFDGAPFGGTRQPVTRRRTARLAVLTAWTLLAGAGVTHAAAPADSKVWVGRYDEFEQLLRSAKVLDRADIPSGVTSPEKLTLGHDGRTFHAIWKPIRRGRHTGFWESHEAEIAAYEMDKLLGLDMVPPTVRREIGGRRGSVQWWVEGAHLYRDVEESAPGTPAWSRQLSRMEMFDVLIGNPDRNAGNILVDPTWQIILIDHSRAFVSRDSLPGDRTKLPVQFDRRILPRLRELDRASLERVMGDLLLGSQIDAVLARRDALLGYLEQLITEKGEARVLFEEPPPR